MSKYTQTPNRQPLQLHYFKMKVYDRAKYIIWIQTQHLAEMVARFLFALQAPQRICEPLPRAHVRSRFENPPKVSRILLEKFLAQGALARRDALLIVFHRALNGIRFFFGEQYVRVRAIWRNRQRVVRECDALGRIRRLEGAIHQFLSTPQVGIAPLFLGSNLSREFLHQTFHHAAVERGQFFVVRFSPIESLGGLRGERDFTRRIFDRDRNHSRVRRRIHRRFDGFVIAASIGL
jgi:hypothetical protein